MLGNIGKYREAVNEHLNIRICEIVAQGDSIHPVNLLLCVSEDRTARGIRFNYHVGDACAFYFKPHASIMHLPLRNYLGSLYMIIGKPLKNRKILEYRPTSIRNDWPSKLRSSNINQFSSLRTQFLPMMIIVWLLLFLCIKYTFEPF